MGEPGEVVGRSAAMPPRPAMSDSTPAPLRKAPPPALTVLAARSLWVASIVGAVAAVVFAFLSRAEQLAPLADIIAGLQPDLDAAERDAVAATVIVGSLSALAIVALAEAILVRNLVVLARGAARWGLLVLVIVNALVCVVVSAFVAVGQYGAVSAGLLVAQLLLACAALVAGFLPSASAWLGREHKSRRGADAGA
ncbi:MAG: hypothetical protein JWR04_200 [Rhodoglobus sp.]|nr:hypothetical protein [Rhodoglobus sp.]